MLERALRQHGSRSGRFAVPHRQKAYNAREGIETSTVTAAHLSASLAGQKAYNAREGIETRFDYRGPTYCIERVRKHTMLERALRHYYAIHSPFRCHEGQKAYNAREGIETLC